MKKGFNPTRRNRNVGTSKQGHGKNNKQGIPALCHDERIWWGNIGAHQIIQHEISGRYIEFIVEATRNDCIHACTIADVCRIISSIPKSDWDGLSGIVFRQPTRKQSLLQPLWGRLAYAANIGKAGKPDVYSGPAILLEATNPAQIFIWEKSLSSDATLELNRLREDGHRIQDHKKYYSITSNPAAARATQLYRTLLHEIGHWVDWLEHVVRPAKTSPDKFSELQDFYFARAYAEREKFAHTYADKMKKLLSDRGIIPFAQIRDEDLSNLTDTL